MSTRPLLITSNTLQIVNFLIWLFAVEVITAGIINTFWGNDPFFGISLILLSFVYFPPVTGFIKERFGFSIHPLLKILLAVFIFMATLGVGELFDKIELVRQDL